MLFNRVCLVSFFTLFALFSFSHQVIAQKSKSVNTASAEAGVAATINGEKILLDSLKQGSEKEIFEAEQALYDLRMDNLKQILIKKLIHLDPRSKGIDDNTFVSQYIAKPFPVSDTRVDAFIKERQIPADKINTNLKEQARRFIMSQQTARQVDVWFEAEQKKHQIKINLTQPLEPRYQVDIEKAAYRGNKNAPVTIVEFSDFQCPYCTRVNSTLYQLTEEYGDKIKVVFKHFPLSSIHPAAIKAAEASICAQHQGMDEFWKLHDEMFKNQRSLTIGSIKDMAKKLGLDSQVFNECFMSEKYAAQVTADTQEGYELGVNSTPAFFINGRFLKGALPLEAFKQIVDEELKSVE